MSEEIYVRKDLHDESMKRIEALMAASEARHERIAEEMRDSCQELKKSIQELKDAIHDCYKAFIRFALIILTTQLITYAVIVLKWLEKN